MSSRGSDMIYPSCISRAIMSPDDDIKWLLVDQEEGAWPVGKGWWGEEKLVKF